MALCLVAWGASSQRSPEAQPVRAGRQRAIIHHTALPMPASRAVASAVGRDAGLPDSALEREPALCAPMVALVTAARAACGCGSRAADDIAAWCSDTVRRWPQPRGEGAVRPAALRCCLAQLSRELDDCGAPVLPASCRATNLLHGSDAACDGDHLVQPGGGCQFDGDCVVDYFCRGDDEGACTPELTERADAEPPVCVVSPRENF